jgi:membrane protease subunit (stomatin/prohibitin family)
MPRILDVIEYADAAGQEIVRRVPERGAGDFRLGSQLVVRESQEAVFYRDGKALDTFGPGRHTITTANLPILSRLVEFAFSGDNPFTAECYFVNTRDFIDMRWGTPEPITLRDEVLRMVRIRAHGTYDMAIEDSQLFVNQFVGARGVYTTRDVTNYLRSMVINRLTDLLGENVTSILDLPAMFDEIAAAARVRLRDDFATMGMALKRLYIVSISPTEETSKAIDEAASMGAVGDMDRYVKFKSARAIGDAATTGGMAGATTQTGLGLATGMAAAKAIADSFNQPAAPAPAPAPQPAAAPAPAEADPVAALSTLKKLLDAGLVSQEEFDAKKAEILSRL